MATRRLMMSSRCDGSPSSNSKRNLRHPIGPGDRVSVAGEDVHPCVGQCRGHVVEESWVTECLDLTSKWQEDARRVVVPLIDEPVGLSAGQRRHAAGVGAVGSVQRLQPPGRSP